MKNISLPLFLKSFLPKGSLIVFLSLAVNVLAYDKTFTVSGNLPGTINASKVLCYANDPSGGRAGAVKVTLPALFVVDRQITFKNRNVPAGTLFNGVWRTKKFTFADYNNTNNAANARTTLSCVETGVQQLSTGAAEVWYQASLDATGNPSINYIGETKPTFGGGDWPTHTICGATSTSDACKNLAPVVKNRFSTLALSGKVSGKITSVYGYSVTSNKRLFSSVLFSVDPRQFFKGSLPVSWFRDLDALKEAGADLPPFNLSVNETFVASGPETLPVYLGDNQYIPDVSGTVFPETKGTSVRPYIARGNTVWKVSELKAMSLVKLQSLNLPWMDKVLNQDNYETWPNKDNPLQAIPEGRDWPPIPPDNVLNLNPTTFARCPDMFQYYSLFRICADKIFSTDDNVDVGQYINYLDHLNSDIEGLDGEVDYTSYNANGSLDGAAQQDPTADRQYDINTLRRLNPNNVIGQNPFEATRFWMIFEEKKFCAAGLCSVDKFFRSWWDDSFVDLRTYWDMGWVPSEIDMTEKGKEYLSEMTMLFNQLSIQRDLLAFPAFNWTTDNAGQYVVGTEGKISFAGLEVQSIISASGYKTYLDNADQTNASWSVYLGNPNEEGEPFSNVRGFVMEGSNVPMQMEHEWHNTQMIDKMYNHYVVQSYPIVMRSSNGYRFSIGTLKIRKLIHKDNSGAKQWFGNGFASDNQVLNNDAPGLADKEDTYDTKSAEYLTDKHNLNERDEMTWKEKEKAIYKIVKYIAISEGLDLGIKALYTYRKEAWLLASKVGNESAIRTTAKYAGKIWRAYKSYRSMMDQMRQVRDATRRLKKNARLLRATYNDAWDYYTKELDYSSIRPTNLTKLIPSHLLLRMDMAMYTTVADLNTIAKNSHLLTLRFEKYYGKAFGREPAIRFHRNEQQEVAQIVDLNSSDRTEKEVEQLQKMKEGNPSLKEPDQVWKLSRITEMVRNQVAGSSLCMSNGYTRAAYNALALAESDSRTWVELKDRTQWQYNNAASIFVSQQTGKAQTDLAGMVLRAAQVTSMPVGFTNPAYYPIENELRGASGTVVTCGGKPCF